MTEQEIEKEFISLELPMPQIGSKNGHLVILEAIAITARRVKMQRIHYNVAVLFFGLTVITMLLTILRLTHD